VKESIKRLLSNDTNTINYGLQTGVTTTVLVRVITLVEVRTVYVAVYIVLVFVEVGKVIVTIFVVIPE
jgi:hypothetical protein